MTNPPPPQDQDDARLHEEQVTEGTPRWVKVFGLVGLLVVVVLIVSQFVGGGHGPGRHLPRSSLPATQGIVAGLPVSEVIPG